MSNSSPHAARTSLDSAAGDNWTDTAGGSGFANPPAWALGWFVTSHVISRNIDERFTNFGASGALVFGLLTWFALAVLLRRTKPEAP
jgi:hypothetical protein